MISDVDDDGSGTIEYEGQSKSAKSGDNSAISMLEYILKQTKKEEEEAHAGEEKDQAEYEDSMTSLKKEQANKEKKFGRVARQPGSSRRGPDSGGGRPQSNDRR